MILPKTYKAALLFAVLFVALFSLVLSGGCGKKNEDPISDKAVAPAGAGMPTPDPNGITPGISKDKDDPAGPK